MLVTNPVKRQPPSKVLTHKGDDSWKQAGADEEGEPRKQMEQRMQVYEDDGMVQLCEPVLVAVQQLGLDVNEVKSIWSKRRQGFSTLL